ncbi:MAG: hypothetical protein AAFV53_00310 [Myxococcota bacterium]
MNIDRFDKKQPLPPDPVLSTTYDNPWNHAEAQEPCPKHPDLLVDIPSSLRASRLLRVDLHCPQCRADRAILQTYPLLDADYHQSERWRNRRYTITREARFSAEVYPTHLLTCPECNHSQRALLSLADLNRRFVGHRCTLQTCGAGLMIDVLGLCAQMTAETRSGSHTNLTLILTEDAMPASQTHGRYHFMLDGEKRRQPCTIVAVDAQDRAEVHISIPRDPAVHRALERQLRLTEGTITPAYPLVRGYDVPRGLSAGQWWPIAEPEAVVESRAVEEVIVELVEGVG